MIISVFGLRDFKGREYSNYDHVASVLDTFEKADKIITGGGKGIEQLALRYAGEAGIEPQVIPPNIAKHGQVAAFSKRNYEIILGSDLIVVFWDGVENYYRELIRTALSQGKHCYVAPVAPVN